MKKDSNVKCETLPFILLLKRIIFMVVSGLQHHTKSNWISVHKMFVSFTENTCINATLQISLINCKVSCNTP